MLNRHKKASTIAEEIARRAAIMWEADDIKTRYFNDWVLFIEECIDFPAGEKGITVYQKEILAAICKHRRASFRGGRGAGKSTTDALAIIAFILTRELARTPWKIVATAGGYRQLENYLWPEVRMWFRRVRWSKLGLEPWREGEEILTGQVKGRFGLAQTAASDNSNLIEGAHAEQQLIIVDEAAAVMDSVFDSLEGMFASSGLNGRETRILVSGRPGYQVGRFYDIHRRKAGLTEWYARHIKLEEAIKAGRVKKEWAEMRRKQWGEASQLYQNHVLGEFASGREGEYVIPLAWVMEAVERFKTRFCDENGHIRANANFGVQMTVGVDVGGGGTSGDPSAFARKCQLPDESQVILPLEIYQAGDTMVTAGRTVQALKSGGLAIVDMNGIGAGTVARLWEMNTNDNPIDVVGFIAQGKTDMMDRSGEIGFMDVRSAAWWLFRERLDPAFNSTVMLPDDDILIAELTLPGYKNFSEGKIRVERKNEIAAKLQKEGSPRDGRSYSTNRADAVIQAFWEEGWGGTATTTVAVADDMSRPPGVSVYWSPEDCTGLGPFDAREDFE